MQRPPGHKALRHGRMSEHGRVYHVTFATAGRVPWFRDPALALAACRTFAPSAVAGGAQLLCWMLMPDHFHGLICLHDPNRLSRCVQRIKGRATLVCRQVRGDHAAIWARGFYDHALRKDEDVHATARYIVANPVRAGLVATAMHYPWWDAMWL